jgi:hypothetical protein
MGFFKLEDLVRHPPEALLRRDRCPRGKSIFYTKADAREMLTRVNATQRTPMRAFRCDYCGHWHIGHRRGAVL